MRVEELHWERSTGWSSGPAGHVDAALVIYFGARDELCEGLPYDGLRQRYPGAHIVGASATRNILHAELHEAGVAAVAIAFDDTRVRVAYRSVAGQSESESCGKAIASDLLGPGLNGILVLADGLLVNGSGLLAGINPIIGPGIPVFGGMAGCPGDYAATVVGADGQPRSGEVAGIGLYGEALRIGTGWAHGWDAMGPRRRITRSTGNVLFELDGRPAIELFQRYVGHEIAEFGAEVVFPLLIAPPDQPEHQIVRAIVRIDPSGGMMFAGDMPMGWTARLMRGNLDRLALAAAEAARRTQMLATHHPSGDSLALIVSCAGRLFLMGQNTPEELDAMSAALAPDTRRIGFYSFGEIVPTGPSATAEMHNQSVAIATLSEAAA